MYEDSEAEKGVKLGKWAKIMNMVSKKKEGEGKVVGMVVVVVE
jgi:hypothetical protein